MKKNSNAAKECFPHDPLTINIEQIYFASEGVPWYDKLCISKK